MITTTAWWLPAMTLAERAANRRRQPRAGNPTAGSPAAPPASPRLTRWRTQRPFDRADYLIRRLRVDELDADAFAELVAGDRSASSASGASGASGADTRPSWVHSIERVNDVGRLTAGRAQRSPARVDASGIAPVRAFVEPFVIDGMQRLFAAARLIHAAYPEAPFEPERATSLFEESLWNRLLTRAMKVVVLEVNVARVRGELVGDTPEARLVSFIDRLRTGDTRQRILEEYPVLARALVTATEHWQRAAAEFLDHLAADADAIGAELLLPACDASSVERSIPRLGRLESVRAGAGDSHRHGRSVIVAGFSSGARVVYKPRSLEVDRHFHALVEWLNARGQLPPLRAVRAIDRRTHGWTEFIDVRACTTDEEVGRFYDRFGAQLALLHALHATDFHFENVIASGEYPMLVDLEALFHPQPVISAELDEPEWLGWDALRRSVLRAGVLPFRADGEQASGMDMSAVGGGKSQLSPDRHPVLVRGGTDEMHLVREHVPLPDANNRPALGTREVNPVVYADRILAGFTTAYRLIAQHRDELTARDGPVRRFAHAPVRIVLRPTRQYALVLGESYHPDVLRDALDRDRLIDRLWVAIPARQELERVIAFEHQDLVNGDVPMFSTRAGSRDVFASDGTRIPGFFGQCGLDTAIARIASFSEDDLVRQQWVVRSSLATLLPGRHEAVTIAAGGATRQRAELPGAPAQSPGHTLAWGSTAEVSRDRCVDAARKVADRLVALAIDDGRHVSWLGLTLVRERDWTVQPIGADLYNGTLGIALFLAHLARVTGDDRVDQYARRLTAQVVRRVRATVETTHEATHVTSGSLGVFGVLGGAAYACAHLAVLWQSDELADLADAALGASTSAIESDRSLDVIGGTAGLMLAAAAVDAVRSSRSSREALAVGATRLVAASTVAPHGIAWTTALASRRPLTGFSHGASGIATALLAAGHTLDDPALRSMALRAFEYERSAFDESRQNWPDFRILDESTPEPEPGSLPSVMWSWCHGAPGIGLARLCALRSGYDAAVLADLDVALRSTARAGFGENDSLCHGDLGNLELLLRARELGYGGSWEQSLTAEGARIVHRIEQGRWRCGIPSGVETPGLMLGLAGIGYGMLRLGAPELTPSVLSLEIPRGALRAASTGTAPVERRT